TTISSIATLATTATKFTSTEPTTTESTTTELTTTKPTTTTFIISKIPKKLETVVGIIRELRNKIDVMMDLYNSEDEDSNYR
ncbi:32285_t:CDS:1, partial [Racocetra persica]